MYRHTRWCRHKSILTFGGCGFQDGTLVHYYLCEYELCDRVWIEKQNQPEHPLLLLEEKAGELVRALVEKAEKRAVSLCETALYLSYGIKIP